MSDSLSLLRPAFHVQIEMLFNLANGHYWLVCRGFYAAFVAVALLLFVRALRVTRWIDFAAAVLALMVLTGLHTFRGMVREGPGVQKDAMLRTKRSPDSLSGPQWSTISSCRDS